MLGVLFGIIGHNVGVNESCAFSATFRPCIVSAIFIRSMNIILNN